YISTHYLPEVINEYFGNGEKLGVQIQYVHETDPLGTGGALSLLPASEIKLPFIVINGDVLTNMNFEKLLEFHEKRD
ncbi:sugar phosphate nucleotidyltransferase, partial [Acinetobacter baumannii]|nr:sugar phosphate nucleotidyltransferase [Acinetobacter baumannii]